MAETVMQIVTTPRLCAAKYPSMVPNLCMGKSKA